MSLYPFKDIKNSLPKLIRIMYKNPDYELK